MRVDPDKSRFHPVADLSDFTSEEIENCEVILRRLRFLEYQAQTNENIASGNGGALHARAELRAHIWVLKDIGFLPKKDREVSRNTPTTKKTGRRQ